jgi:hypothetical protein
MGNCWNFKIKEKPEIKIILHSKKTDGVAILELKDS